MTRLLWTCAVFGLAGAGYGAYRWAATRPDRQPVEQERVVLVPDANPGYVGWETCARCHAERAAECQATSHFRTCRPPRAGEMPPGFTPEQGSYFARSAGVPFEMRQTGDTFTQTAITRTPAGERRVTSPIDLVLGAGTADDVYLSWQKDGRMVELPVAWLWPTGEWANSHFCTPYGTGDYSRDMTVRCLECHNTWIEQAPGTTSYYQRAGALLGVTCERCHGPGREHVAHHEAHPDEKIGVGIRNPRGFARERLIEVCTQCHSNAVTHREAPFTYLPGEPLEAHYRTHQIAHPEDDHVASQIDGLRQSRCFQQSETMTCITCHDPHQQRRPELEGAAACAKCHQPADCRAQEQLPADVRASCIECHMPKRLKINVKFEVAGDNFVPPIRRSQHRMAVDEIARDEVLLRWHRSQNDPASEAEAARLTTRLVDYWLGQAEERRLERRFMAAIGAVREALAVQDSPATREVLQNLVEVQAILYDGWAKALHQIGENQAKEAAETIETLITLRPEDAEYHAKLGTIRAMLGETERAVQHLDLVARLDPNNAAGFGVLGRIAFRNRKFDEALAQWTQGEAIEPYLPQIQYDLGMALLEQGKAAEALPKLRRASQIDPTRVDILIALAEALARAGEWDQAIATGVRAGSQTEGGDPEQSKQVAAWVESLRERASTAQARKKK